MVHGNGNKSQAVISTDTIERLALLLVKQAMVVGDRSLNEFDKLDALSNAIISHCEVLADEIKRSRNQ